mgnify:CR=1 FL=1
MRKPMLKGEVLRGIIEEEFPKPIDQREFDEDSIPTTQRTLLEFLSQTIPDSVFVPLQTKILDLLIEECNKDINDSDVQQLEADLREDLARTNKLTLNGEVSHEQGLRAIDFCVNLASLALSTKLP